MLNVFNPPPTRPMRVTPLVLQKAIQLPPDLQNASESYLYQNVATSLQLINLLTKAQRHDKSLRHFTANITLTT